jgi:hypothetical protein
VKLGELRESIVQVMELGTDNLNIKLSENAEVVVASEECWLRVTSVSATFLRGRWTLLLGTVERGAPMWDDDPSVTVVHNGAEKKIAYDAHSIANVWLLNTALEAFHIPQAEAARLRLFTDGGVELDDDSLPSECGVHAGHVLTLRSGVVR